MGLRTQRYGPRVTTRRGASHGPGVPRPTAAKFHAQHRYRTAPAAMTRTAVQTTGEVQSTAGLASLVASHTGTQTPPSPGTTMVKTTLRMSRLSISASYM